MIEVSLENKETGEVIHYKNVTAFDAYGADDAGPVFQFMFPTEEQPRSISGNGTASSVSGRSSRKTNLL